MSGYQGQYWTPLPIAKRMLALRQNFGSVLEPCCGTGAISDQVPGVVALEVDATLPPPPYALVDEFLDWSADRLFDTIIGNPPYVRRGGRLTELLTASANLYLVFIEQAVRHLSPAGELIYIVPREWLNLTSAKKLVAWMRTQGCITDWIEAPGKSAGWSGADVDTAIFRFELGAQGRWPFDADGAPLDELFEIVVGAVTGDNKAYADPAGTPLLCSDRTIRHFRQGKWIRQLPVAACAPTPRIFLNAKTRRPDPFFLHPAVPHDGSLLALIPRDPATDLTMWCQHLNSVDWFARGFGCDGRLTFPVGALKETQISGSPVQQSRTLGQYIQLEHQQ